MIKRFDLICCTKEMDTSTQMSAAKSQKGSRSFTRALALAFNEWLLMLMLFANSIFSYVITRFADYSQLQSPCIMCSRLDHILGRTEEFKETHWDMFCSKHKSEISSLVYCNAQDKLVDIRGMCETCLTTNKSNGEGYRLLVSDPRTSPRCCTCCNQMCMPQTVSTDEVLAKPETVPKKTGKRSTTPKKSVRFNDLPHVGYTEVKVHSDTESEDEGVAVQEKDHRLQDMDVETPPVITLPHDLATDKLINLETSEKVLKEEEITPLDNTFVTSHTMEHSALVLNEKEDLIHKEIPADALMEVTDQLILVNCVSETSGKVLKEEDITEALCLNDVTSTSVAAETSEDISMGEAVLKVEEELLHLHDTSTSVASEAPEDLLMEETVLQEKEELVHLQDTSLIPDCKETPADDSMKETELTCLNDVTTSTSSDATETTEHVLKGTECLPLDTSKERDTNQADTASLESEYVVVSPSKSTNSMPEDSTENCVSENKETKETSLTISSVSQTASHTEAAPESESSSFNSMSVAAETNLDSGELLDLADAYNIIVHNEGNKDSKRGGHIEQWMKKDSSRVSEDLKALLTQISASRGIEFLSPRTISRKLSSDQETKNIDYDMQLMIQKRMLERNESSLSLEGVSVSDIEGESEIDRLKRQVDHDRNFLTGLYKELEEERSASAVATNQAMAMITRLQEEKALFQMEALQNLRMMEEQAEYDMEAIQKLNELLVEKEKLIQDLEGEIHYLRDQTLQKKNVTEIDSSNKMQDCLNGFNEERLYITSCLEKIETMVQRDGDGEAHVDNIATQESVSELSERVEKLKGDLYFLEHVVNSLEHGSEGVQFVKEIASHLQSLSMKRHNHTES